MWGGVAVPVEEPRRPRRQLAWRADAPQPRRRDLRDQLGLRIGWVRFFLRSIALGLGLWLIGASLQLWAALQGLVPPFFYVGLLLMPLGAILALLVWVAPLPFERESRCPACQQSRRMLHLPWRLEFICPSCGRKGHLLQGRIELRREV